MDPNNLNIRDVLKAIAPLVVLVVGIFFLATGKQVLGLALLVPAILFLFYCLTKLPWQEVGRVEYEKEEKQKKTILGRVWVHTKHVFGYLSILCGAILLLGFIYMVYSSLTGGNG